MNKMTTKIRSIIALGVLVILSSCGNDAKEPANSISDDSGLSIDLNWTTSGNVPTALLQADLDLDVYKGEGEILSSYNTNEFEHVDFTDLLEDGVYTVKISMYEISKKSNYTLKISGATKNKTFKVSGFLDGNNQSTIPVLKITKEGDHFTLAQL
ncbi:MAG: hypothetical protein C0490_01310 [Marivirga sp.]|nr:hypothetical protein [Marivirga sp.]